MLWIWGDRALDGKTTGIASTNNTHRAIDTIPKDIMICDWHYERPYKTAVYFAMKGFKVVTCPWRNRGVAVAQAEDMVNFLKDSTPMMKKIFKGRCKPIGRASPVLWMGFTEKRKIQTG